MLGSSVKRVPQFSEIEMTQIKHDFQEEQRAEIGA